MTFGPRVEFYDVEQAVKATLQTWLDTFLNNVELRSPFWNGSRPIQRPGSWEVMSAFHDIPGARLPAISIESAGMAAEPERAAAQIVNGGWEITVQIVVRAKSRDLSRRILSAYEAAVRDVLFAHGDLSGFAVGTDVGRPRYDLVKPDRDRTLLGAEVPLVVWVDAINGIATGPATPDPLPSPPPSSEPDAPTHTSTNIAITAGGRI